MARRATPMARTASGNAIARSSRTAPGRSYGKIPWNEAMRRPGSRQVGFGKKLFEQYAWQQFRPHPEWAAFASEGELSFEACQWIWFPEGNPAQNAPVAKRSFRRAFVVPEARTIKDA